MDNVNSKTIKAGSWYIASNFLLQGIGFLTMPLFTRIMSQEDLGFYNNFNSWLSLLSIIVTLEMYSSINRARFDYEEKLDSFLSSILLCGTAFTGICYLIVLTFQDFFISLFNMNIVYIHVMFTHLMIVPATKLLATNNQMLMKYKSASFFSIAPALAATLISLLLVMVSDDKAWGKIIGGTGSLTIFNLALYLFILYKGRKFEWEFCKYALRIAIPLVPHLLSSNILGTTDQIIITRYWGTEYTALYNIAYLCSVIFMILQSSVNHAWVPWLFEQLHRQNHNLIKKVSRPYIFIFCAISIAIMLFAPELVLIIGGDNYRESVFLMPPLIAGRMFAFLYTFYANVEFYHKKTFGIAKNTIIAAAVNLILNILLIPVWGYIMAAYTTLIGYLVLLCTHFYSCRKLKVKEFYDNKFIFCTAAVLFIISMMIIPLYHFPVARYLLIVACAAISGLLIYLHRDKLSIIRQSLSGKH